MTEETKTPERCPEIFSDGITRLQCSLGKGHKEAHKSFELEWWDITQPAAPERSEFEVGVAVSEAASGQDFGAVNESEQAIPAPQESPIKKNCGRKDLHSIHAWGQEGLSFVCNGMPFTEQAATSAEQFYDVQTIFNFFVDSSHATIMQFAEAYAAERVSAATKELQEQNQRLHAAYTELQLEKVEDCRLVQKLRGEVERLRADTEADNRDWQMLETELGLEKQIRKLRAALSSETPPKEPR